MSRLFGPAMQNGYVVRDLAAAIAHWTTRIGVGPFYLFPRVTFAQSTYRGHPAAIEMKVAMAYSGNLQIELIEPTSETPSIYREFLDRGFEGLHHLGVLTDRFDVDVERLAGLGHVAVQDGRVGAGTGFAYYDTGGTAPGSMIELIEASRGIQRLFEHVREAAQSWNGCDPVREA